VLREFENRTADTVERVDERSLVSRRLHGDHVKYVRNRTGVHDHGHLRATVAVGVRDHMGHGCSSRV
jgi:hypothetical protein